MKLYYNKTSPYARKARVTAIERGWAGRLQFVDIDPWSDPPALIATTPLCKVPALELAPGLVITESALIADYLDRNAGGEPLGAADGAAADALQMRLGLAQGITDAAFDTAMERRRPAQLQWPDWIARQRRAIERGIAVLGAMHWPQGRFDSGDVAVACALDYVDFRLPEIAWRARQPALAAAADAMLDRASLRQTDPR